ncbi:MAG: TlpA family protein disulfide reductase [Candidatus Dormibacteria bacterium]
MSDPPGPPSGYLGISRRPSRREWRRALILFAVGIVGLIVVVLVVHPQANLLPLGTAAPAISLDSVGGGHVDVAASANGRPYIVEFFEAGCAHCQQVAGQLCKERVAVFAVDAAKDSAPTISSYRSRYAARCGYPLLLDPKLSAGSAYNVNVVPTVYLVKAGRIAYAGAGLDGVNGLGSAVAKALGG